MRKRHPIEDTSFWMPWGVTCSECNGNQLPLRDQRKQECQHSKLIQFLLFSWMIEEFLWLSMSHTVKPWIRSITLAVCWNCEKEFDKGDRVVGQWLVLHKDNSPAQNTTSVRQFLAEKPDLTRFHSVSLFPLSEVKMFTETDIFSTRWGRPEPL
jgi:hypothetical protein